MEKVYALSDLCVLPNLHLLSVCYGINTALGTRNRKEERYRGGCGRHTGRLVTSIFLFFLLSRAVSCVAAEGKSTTAWSSVTGAVWQSRTGMCLEAGNSEFKFRFCPLVAMWPKTNCSASLSLSFSIYNRDNNA